MACHQQLGVTSESALRRPGTPLSAQKFHPPGFTDLTRTSPNHHSFEAQANIQTCVACHQESTCMQCHSATTASRIGGGVGVDPHPPGFAGSGTACRAIHLAPIACAKCHGGGAGLPALRQRLANCN